MVLIIFLFQPLEGTLVQEKLNKKHSNKKKIGLEVVGRENLCVYAYFHSFYCHLQHNLLVF